MNLRVVIVGLLVGVGSWWFTNFIFHPWKEVQELRRKSRFEIIYWSNVSLRTSSHETQAAGQDAFRKVAFALVALNETSPRFIKLLKFTSYDLTAAADGMINLSHEIMGEGDDLYRAICRHDVEKALLLRQQFSDEDYERIKKKWADDNDNGFGDDVSLNPVDELFMFADMRKSE